MTQQAPSILETVFFYGLEDPEKMYARYRIGSQKCILLFYSPPPDDFNDEKLEQGLITYNADQDSFFLRLDLATIREILKVDVPNTIDKTMTDYLLTVIEIDGLKHYMCFTSLAVREEWYSHVQPHIGKRKSTVYQSLPITGVSPHQPLVIGNADNIETVSSSGSDSGDERADKRKDPMPNKAIILKGNPLDYPALANWSTSLVRYGYGSKKGAKRKNWKCRFFVLTQHSFAYFVSERKKNPICSIPISNVRAIYQRKDLQGHEFVMAIDTDDRMHLWEFHTEEELRGWMEDFADHVTIKHQLTPHKTTSQKISSQSLPSISQTADVISSSLPASLHAAVETQIYDGAVVRKKVVGKSGHKPDTDSDDSGEDETCNGEVSKNSKALLGIDSASFVRYGYCMKEGGVVHNWKKRFFVLTKGTLSYFKSPNDSQPLKVIKVNTMTSILESPLYQGRNFVIAITTQSRIFYMQCDSHSLALEWIHDVTKCKEYQDRFKPAVSSSLLSEPDEILSFSPSSDSKGFESLDTIAPK